VIALAPGTKVYLATKPVSMRLGFDGLSALVRPLFSAEPYAGHVFLFRSNTGFYLKALYWDGSGLCLFAKRLEKGRFVWPPLIEGGMVLTPAQFALLLEAMDWRRTVAREASQIPVHM
jgi:transposase